MFFESSFKILSSFFAIDKDFKKLFVHKKYSLQIFIFFYHYIEHNNFGWNVKRV